MAVRSCWQSRSVFCAGLRWQQQIFSSFHVASSVCIWSVRCAVSSLVSQMPFLPGGPPVLNNSKRFSEGTSSSTNRFQTPSTSRRCRHHLSCSHCVAIGLVDPQISFHWRIVAWSGLPFTLPVPGSLHRGHTSGCVCHVPGHFVLKTPLFPKHRAQNVNGILELSLMSPQAMSDAYALSVAVWFLFQTHQFLRQIGSRVGHFANCPPCMVGIRPRCPSLAKAPSHGCFAHLLAVEPDFPFPRSPLVPGPQSQRSRFSFGHTKRPTSSNDPLAVALSSLSSWGPLWRSLGGFFARSIDSHPPFHTLLQWTPPPRCILPPCRHRSLPFHTLFTSVQPLLLALRLLQCKPTRLSMVQLSPTHLRFLDPQHLPTVPRHFLVLDPFVSPDSWRCHATSIMPL